MTDAPLSRDLDPIDIFIGPHKESELFFVIDQIDQQTGDFDEHKVIAGVRNESEARALYLSNYEAGWKCGEIQAFTKPDFFAWLKNPAKTQTRASSAPTKATVTESALNDRVAAINRAVADGVITEEQAGELLVACQVSEKQWGKYP